MLLTFLTAGISLGLAAAPCAKLIVPAEKSAELGFPDVVNPNPKTKSGRGVAAESVGGSDRSNFPDRSKDKDLSNSKTGEAAPAPVNEGFMSRPVIGAQILLYLSEIGRKDGPRSLDEIRGFAKKVREDVGLGKIFGLGFEDKNIAKAAEAVRTLASSKEKDVKVDLGLRYINVYLLGAIQKVRDEKDSATKSKLPGEIGEFVSSLIAKNEAHELPVKCFPNDPLGVKVAVR